MTDRTVTSEDLAALADSVAEAASRNELLVVPALYASEDTVLFAYPEVGLDTAFELAAKQGAVFVTLDTKLYAFDQVSDVFEYGEIADDVDGFAEGLPDFGPPAPDLRRALQPFESHEGDIYSLELRWTSGGAVFLWEATASWAHDFAAALSATSQARADQRRQENELENEEHDRTRAAIAERTAQLEAHPEFRAAAQRQRRVIAPVLLADLPGNHEFDDEDWVIREAVSLASAGSVLAARKVTADVDAYAERLRSSDGWYMHLPAAERDELARAFLLTETDGYSVPPAITTSVRKAADELDRADPNMVPALWRPGMRNPD